MKALGLALLVSASVVFGQTPAEMLSPTNNATLTGTNQTFSWSAGTGTNFGIWVGSATNTRDFFAAETNGTSVLVTGLPANGSNVYTTLFTASGGQWYSNLYSFTAYNAPRAATMVSPTNGAVLTTPQATFTWEPGVAVTSYALWVGSAFGTYDLYAGFETGLVRQVNVPPLGGSIYAQLYSLINGTYQTNYYTYSVPAGVAASILSPTNGATLEAPSQTFTWTNAVGATNYAIWVGYAPGESGIFASTIPSSNSSVSVPTPVNGSNVYVRMFSCITNNWAYRDYSYVASFQTLAQMASPTNGATLGAPLQMFNWIPGVGVSNYSLTIGSASNTSDIFSGLFTGSNAVVTVPGDGRDLYVKLSTRITNSWIGYSYRFTAALPGAAEIISPTNGTQLTSGSVVFSWGGGNNITQYALWLGTHPGSNDYFNASLGANRFQSFLNLPENGQPLYARLFSLSGNTWLWSDSSYTCASNSHGAFPAVMISPSIGSVLNGSIQTFYWTTGFGVTNYALQVGTDGWRSNVFHWSGTNLSVGVTGIPSNGSMLYVGLISIIDGREYTNGYTYLAPSYSIFQQILFRRGVEAQRTNKVFALAEPLVSTNFNSGMKLFLGDGVTLGGRGVLMDWEFNQWLSTNVFGGGGGLGDVSAGNTNVFRSTNTFNLAPIMLNGNILKCTNGHYFKFTVESDGRLNVDDLGTSLP